MIVSKFLAKRKAKAAALELARKLDHEKLRQALQQYEDNRLFFQFTTPPGVPPK